jgi:hypothetical protein
LLLGIVFILVGFFPLGASAQYTLDLNGLLYGQDTSFYCGAASAQMIMQNYPNPAGNACFGQAHIYNRIQAHKQDNGYYSDPEGLRGAIMELNSPPAGGRFSIFHDADRNQVMHSMLYWMAEREYPSATLVNSGDRWVVVTGFATNVDPRMKQKKSESPLYGRSQTHQLVQSWCLRLRNRFVADIDLSGW